MQEPIRNILISLHKGYGVGDGCQMSAVLRHVKKYRPNWRVDYQAEEGKHQAGYGLVQNTFAYGDLHPTNHYDAEVQILLYDTWANFGDRPNTRVSSCLHERFGLNWDKECGQYQVNLTNNIILWARNFLRKVTGHLQVLSPLPKVVAVHYQGDSDKSNKDLTHLQASVVMEHISHLGRIPLMLDWRNQWPTALIPYVKTTGGKPESRLWGLSIQMNCALISQCEAFVGIDSGPSKCASATDTPSLVTWTGHHPAPFHDPAPNTTHLVPHGYHGLQPVCNDAGVIRFFEENYNVRQYDGDPVKEIKEWLTETLR